jgi:uncharacterized protein (TIGR02145 family)
LLNVNSPNTFSITDNSGPLSGGTTVLHDFQIENIKNNFTGSGNPDFTYIGQPTEVTINFNISWKWYNRTSTRTGSRLRLYKNGNFLFSYSFFSDTVWNQNFTIITSLATNDKIYFEISITNATIDIYNAQLIINSTNPVTADISLNDQILLGELTPRNVLQVDFFTWLVKMFNLYVTEDKIKEKHLLIEPYVDYYDLTESIDWTYKVARDKPWQIKPMGMLNGRFFEYKFKTDNDYYNEKFRKKFGMSYGDALEDTKFQFAKAKQTLEVGFSPTPLIEYEGSGIDKVVPAIYKLTKGNAVEQEEWIESNIRIMMAKKMTGVNSWNIVNRGALLNQPPTNIGASLTAYGYAGHFDDPKNPTVDINFGAAAEIYFDPLTYPSANLFNEYWSGYIAEIADKDSKLLTCHVYLNDLDIAQLDFSKPVFIDGVLWRINKVMDYDSTSGELTKVELLKVIDTGFGVTCAGKWTKVNYDGTKFRNGDTIPQVTDTTEWAALTTPAWCHYNNDPANDAIYGKLYNWYAVNDPRGFAPFGYRVPTDQDWNGLVNCLGGDLIAGGSLKSITGWNPPNTGATNESGFGAIGAGGRSGFDGIFSQLGEYGYFWSATGSGTNTANSYYILDIATVVFTGATQKKSGFSVRLIKEN